MLTARPVVLASKLYKPALPRTLVRREALVERLRAGADSRRRLTLISAPAGYGKTTLAVEWLEQVGCPAAWLSLDEADNDPLRFFIHWCAALRAIGASFDPAIENALSAGQLPAPAALTGVLLNGLMALEAPGVCVLDDFQVIEEPIIVEFLQTLAAHQLPQFHLALLTREDPPLPLARLRAAAQLTEIRAADLRFDAQETRRFLRQGMGLPLSDDEIDRLEERTEGWPVGLQLAALAVQSPLLAQPRPDPAARIAAITGSHRFFSAYLTGEVLNGQPPEMQSFLLQSSILERFTAGLCAAVTGQANSAAMIAKLMAANLFLIPLDDDGVWFRYHHLFADLLHRQLERAHAELLPELHMHAAVWFERQSLPAEAIEHMLSAGDFEGASRLLEAHGWELLNQGYARQMELWMQALPPAVRRSTPRSALAFGWMHLLRINFPQAQAYIAQAQDALAQMPHGERAQAVRAEILTLQASLLQAQGDMVAAVAAAQTALAQIPQQDQRLTGLAWLALGAAYRATAGFDLALDALQHAMQAARQSQDWLTWTLAMAQLGLLAIYHGRLRLAEETAADAVGQLQRLGVAPTPIVGAVYGVMGWVEYETDQLEAAREHLVYGEHLAEFSGHSRSLFYCKMNLVRLHQAAGDWDAASRLMEELSGLMRSGAPGWAQAEFIYRQVSWLAAQGELAGAEAVLRASGVSPEDAITRRTDWVHLAWLRLFVSQGAPQAMRLAERITEFSEADQRHGTTLQALALGALAGGGASWLSRALALAEPEGYRRIFLDNGMAMAALLRQLPQSAYARALLAGFEHRAPVEGKREPSTLSAGDGTVEPLLEPLTEREMDVLRLLAEGLSYAEIAARLVVSVNTVRFHVKKVYAKLGVDKQAKAIGQARRLGLL